MGLEEDIRLLAQLNDHRESAGEVLKQAKAEWELENADKILAVKHLDIEIEDLRTRIKSAVLVEFKQTGEKPGHPALGIRGVRELIGDPKRIEMWVRAFHPELLQYDPKEALAFVRDAYDKGTTLPDHFMLLDAKLDKAWQVTIASDLSKYLELPESDE